ncbi:MAG: PEGA domain-containing protein [Saprospiraceae bacterium]|nr:PEGA domain-containing protein [Saprospiraceae bacterium]
MRRIKIFLLAGLFLGLSSCGTIILGSKQSVGISSTPSSAKIFINDEEVGLTPNTIDIKKSDAKSFEVRIELNGYESFETVLTRKTSGWIAGNIVFGGLIGLAVDFATGGAYVLTPEQIEAELGNRTSMMINSDDSIQFFVTLQPQENWVKIGQLTPNNLQLK